MEKGRIFIILLLFGTFFAGFFVSQQRFTTPVYTVATPFETAPLLEDSEKKTKKSTLSQLTREDLKIFFEAWNALEENYTHPPRFKEEVGEKKEEEERAHETPLEEKTSRQYIFNAIQGLITTPGDPYTIFLPKKESSDFSREIIEGEIDGIGVYIGKKKDFNVVIAPLDGSPAQKAGLRSGDIILFVDKKDVMVKSIDQIVEMIRGKRGTEVEITFFRPGTQEEKTRKIVRQKISVPSVRSAEIDDVFIVKVSGFTRKTAAEFEKVMDEFVNKRYEKLIIDLRNNPGGVLEVVVSMAGFFVSQEKPILYEYDGSSSLRGYYMKKDRVLKNIEDIDIVVLINGGSASASEIFAGALRAYDRATLIGKNSYGKGSIQKLVPLSDGSSLKVTHSYWLLPDKTIISENGVAPDISVKKDENEESDDTNDKDIMLGISGNDPFVKEALYYLRHL